MSTTHDLSQVKTAEENLHNTLLEILNSLLDTYYDEHPLSNAYGSDSHDPDIGPRGSWFIGRADGSQGAESERGIDYAYRVHPGDPTERGDEKNYLVGKYGWMDANEFLDLSDDLGGVLEEAAESGFISEDEVETYYDSIEEFEETLNDIRQDIPLNIIAEHIHEHNNDILQTLLGLDEEDSRVIWMLQFSKDEDGDIIENEIETPVIEDGLMFARTERYYAPDDKWSAFGVVIGYDDTPAGLFVHRLQWDRDLGNPDFEWTLGAIKEKMGFDLDYDKIPSTEIPFDTTVRLQGDVSLTRRDFTTVMWEYYDETLKENKNSFLREYNTEITEAHEEIVDHDNIYVSQRSPSRINVRLDETDELKSLQEDINIDEEDVREEQEHRGYSRLTAKRRKEIIEYFIKERFLQWGYENISEADEEEIEVETELYTRTQFNDTQDQVNLVIGNHAVVLGPALEHPDRDYTRERDCIEAIVVPDEATGFIWHDEHQNKKVRLPKGIYEFNFLQGHEEQWWMN